MTSRKCTTEKGVTFIEVIIVIGVTAILASAFIAVAVPQINSFFFMPDQARVQNAAADLLQIITEGDDRARGLRFAGPACSIPTGGTTVITAASATSLTYRYAQPSDCGTGGTNHNVVIAYDSGTHTVTRNIDGTGATVIPSYVVSGSTIDFDPPSGINFFRYYNAAGTDQGSSPTVTNIYRVDITVVAISGSANPRYGHAKTTLKTGVEIKQDFP